MRENCQWMWILVVAVLTGCGAGVSTAPEAPAFVEMTEDEKCQAAEEYMIDCGGDPIVSFQNSCTGDLAEDLLSLDCGQLDDALEAAGIVTTPAAPSFGGANPTIKPGNYTGFGASLACSMGFNFACPVPECTWPAGTAPGPNDNCLDWLAVDGCGQCEYYACREKQNQCGEEGYLLGYVGKYCKRFSSVTQPKLSPAGQAWMDNVRECLVEVIDSSTDSNTSCSEIETIGVASHASCYAEAGFCSLSLTDWFAIVHTIDPGDLPFKQLLATGQQCAKSWMGF